MKLLPLMLGMSLTTSVLPAQGTGIVSGVVRDEVGAPVREVLVVIDPDSLSLRTRTGGDGSYRITVPAGRYEVRVVRIGYKPQSHTIAVAGPTTELDIRLQSIALPLSTVTVRVSRPGLYGQVITRGIELLPHEPRPLADANVEVLNEPFSIKTDADGRFSIPQLPVGSHTIMVRLDRYATRMTPVTVPPEGGIELTFTLDSLYAEYQFRDEDQMRAIGWRMRRASSPATFVSAHEIDPEAESLLQALRYAPSVLSRGIIFQNQPVIIYVDGKLAGGQRDVPDSRIGTTTTQGAMLQDLKPADIAGIEVYPAFSLPPDAGGLPGNTGRIGAPIFTNGQRGRGSFSNRTLTRTRGNPATLIMIWTTKRR
jgi:hypothetical protein